MTAIQQFIQTQQKSATALMITVTIKQMKTMYVTNNTTAIQTLMDTSAMLSVVHAIHL
jgi:hypothetical protein